MNAETRLRPVTGADGEFLRRLYASVREEELALGSWTSEQRAIFVEMQFTAQSRHYSQYFPAAEHSILERGGEPIGRVLIDRTDDEIRVVDVALLTAHRSSGIGTALLTSLLEEGKQANRPVRLCVEHSNRALRLYERLGFVRAGDRGVHLELEWSPTNSVPAPC